MSEINPFDMLSGKVVQNESGTFWFKEAGNNMQPDGWPIFANLHRTNDLPAAIWSYGLKEWYIDGVKYKTNGRPEWAINEKMPPNR